MYLEIEKNVDLLEIQELDLHKNYKINQTAKLRKKVEKEQIDKQKL